MGQIGVSLGCGGSLFCPSNVVTRGLMALWVMRGGFNQLLPANAPLIVFVTPTTVSPGQTVTATIMGQYTNWFNGVTQVNAGPGITVTNISVANFATLTMRLTIAADAQLGPRSITATTGSEEATLPNVFQVQ
jgi:hypothetical protein